MFHESFIDVKMWGNIPWKLPKIITLIENSVISSQFYSITVKGGCCFMKRTIYHIASGNSISSQILTKSKNIDLILWSGIFIHLVDLFSFANIAISRTVLLNYRIYTCDLRYEKKSSLYCYYSENFDLEFYYFGHCAVNFFWIPMSAVW